MALNILLFCALVFASQGIYGLSNSNLVETVENLQKQLKLLSKVVDRLEAENDALKTREHTLEKLQVGSAGEQFILIHTTHWKWIHQFQRNLLQILLLI